VERVLDAYAPDPLGRVMRTLTLTAAWTGIRRGELLGLRWGAVDFDAEKIHVDESYVLGGYDPPKSGHGRSVPLPARVARELRAIRLATPYAGDGDPVFAHPEGTGKPLDASYVSKAFSVALKAAGAPPRRFHDLRHTYAVHAAKAGIPLTDLREWLGHADLTTTSIYARYCPREGEAERVERAMTAVA
jgi:integrase